MCAKNAGTMSTIVLRIVTDGTNKPSILLIPHFGVGLQIFTWEQLNVFQHIELCLWNKTQARAFHLLQYMKYNFL